MICSWNTKGKGVAAYEIHEAVGRNVVSGFSARLMPADIFVVGGVWFLGQSCGARHCQPSDFFVSLFAVS